MEAATMRYSTIGALVLSAIVLFTGCGNSPKKPEKPKNDKPAVTESAKPTATEKGAAPSQGASKKQNALGALKPEQALEYMKTTKDLVIVDVAPRKAWEKGHFIGAIHIPMKTSAKKRKTNGTKRSLKGNRS